MSMYDDPGGPITADKTLRNLRLEKYEAEQEGDAERIEQASDAIREYCDYMTHCQEKAWELEWEDARFERYWDDCDA